MRHVALRAEDEVPPRRQGIMTDLCRRRAPFRVIFKAVVGFSLGALVLYGATAPRLGLNEDIIPSGAVAGLGAVLGLMLVLKE